MYSLIAFENDELHNNIEELKRFEFAQILLWKKGSGSLSAASNLSKNAATINHSVQNGGFSFLDHGAEPPPKQDALIMYDVQ